MATITITLQRTDGSVCAFKPDSAADTTQALAGVREAIITVFGNDPAAGRAELLRADLPGSAWKSLLQAGAVGELAQQLQDAAQGLEAGFAPQLVVQLDENNGLTNGRLVCTQDEFAELTADPKVRHLGVPRLMSYQLGGEADGSSVLLVKRAGQKKIEVHSVHPTAHEAMIAEEFVKSQCEASTTRLLVQTPVTMLIDRIRKDAFKAADEPTGSAERRPLASPLMPAALAEMSALRP